ncbi:MAG: DNA polymerase III subunit beta [Acidaminococcaceae bacterium]
MKFTCKTQNIAKAVQVAKKAISSNPSVPIFSGIHLLIEDEQLIINAMDLNMAINCKIAVAIEEKGEIVIPAKQFAELLSSLQTEEVTIAKNENKNNILITSGKANFEIPLMNEADYPKFPLFNGDKQLIITDEMIKELIKKTIYACSTDETRPLFTGILLEKKGQQVTFVGTNTHRLAIKTITLEQADESDLSIIIPARALKEIISNLGNDLPQDVVISLLNRQIMIQLGNTTIVSSLIEGNFPDYRRVIPGQFNIKTTFKIKELEGAVKRVALFSSDNDYSIIKISINNNEIVVNSSSNEVGSGMESINCQTTGESLNVAFNARYILEILKNIDGEEATMELNSALSPICIKSDNDEQYLYIVTPVRVVV